MKITTYFSLEEFTKSRLAIQNGIDNTPSIEEESNVVSLVKHLLDPVRRMYGKPIIVTSGFRSKELNSLLKNSSPTSQHMTGQAADIQTVGDKDNKKLFDLLNSMDFDQLIWEYGTDEQPDWVHVSYVSTAENRHEVLKAVKVGNKTVYQHI